MRLVTPTAGQPTRPGLKRGSVQVKSSLPNCITRPSGRGHSVKEFVTNLSTANKNRNSSWPDHRSMLIQINRYHWSNNLLR